MKLLVNKKDILEMVGNVTLDSNTDTLGDQLNFTMAYNPPYLSEEINVGNFVQLIYDFDDKEVFYGIIVKKTRNESEQEFNCLDFAFYLNKSKVIKQFKNIRADLAIKQLLAECDVPVGYIASMSILITKIYYDKEVSAIIQEVLDEVMRATGAHFVMEMNSGKLEIYQDTERLVKATVKLANNLAPIDCMQTISAPTKSFTIEDMKNSVKLYIGSDNGVKVFAEAVNQSSVKQFGLLQETQSIEDKDIAQANNMAQNLLKQMGKVSINASITVLGSFDLRANRIVEINEFVTNIVGKYKIKSASHDIGTIHTTKLELEAI